MGALKNYFLHLLETCAPEDGLTQDAIEYALVCGLVSLTGDLQTDVAAVLSQREAIALAYYRHLNQTVGSAADPTLAA
jgi:hypothetical protein